MRQSCIRHIYDHGMIQNPSARTFPLHTELETPIPGCYTMLNEFYDTEYPEQWGKHNDHEGFFVISGFGDYWLDGKEYNLTPGMSMFAPAGTLHGLRKKGESDLKVFIFHFPAQKEQPE